MDESTLDDLRAELAALEAVETQISAERRRLHQRIDLGYATAETRAREREVSDERRRLHRRIDSLRELLQPHDPLTETDNAPSAPESPPSRLSEWTGVSAELLGADDAGSEELEL